MQASDEVTDRGISGEMGALTAAAAASVTPRMVAHLGGMAEAGATAMDVLAEPEVLQLLEQVRQAAPALSRTLARVQELSASGTLDSLLDLAEVVRAFYASSDDGMIAAMANVGSRCMEAADGVLDSGMAERAPALLSAVRQAADEARDDRRGVGLWALWRLRRTGEFQFLARFLVALTRRLPQVLKG